MDPADTLMLLLDHQTGLFQVVKDIPVAQLRANVTALAKLATLLKLPVITTASVPDGPNGPLMPEHQEAAPHAQYIPRHGEVNAWDNEAFVKAVRDTGKTSRRIRPMPSFAISSLSRTARLFLTTATRRVWRSADQTIPTAVSALNPPLAAWPCW
jgi:nicotinamidase-related amidase